MEKLFICYPPTLCPMAYLWVRSSRAWTVCHAFAKGYQFEKYVTDTVAFIQNQVGEPVYLIGHSLGGLVSIGVAAAMPDMVRAIALEDPPLYGFKGARLRARPFYKLFVGWRDLASTEGSVEEIADQLATLQPDMDAAERRFKARSLQLLDPDVLTMYVDGSATGTYEIDELLSKITCPTLFLPRGAYFRGSD